MSKTYLYQYTAGSKLHGLDIEASDHDVRGVYINPSLETKFGFEEDKTEKSTYESEEGSHEEVFYELKHWVHLLAKSNPTIIEGLFVPRDKISITSPFIEPFLNNPTEFIDSARLKKSVLGQMSADHKKLQSQIDSGEEYSVKKLINSMRLSFCCKTYLTTGAWPSDLTNTPIFSNLKAIKDGSLVLSNDEALLASESAITGLEELTGGIETHFNQEVAVSLLEQIYGKFQRK